MKFYSKSRWQERKNSFKANLGFFRNRNWEGVNVAFVVSTGRTGTQFLTRFFRGLSPQIDARHEPNPDFLKLGVDFARGKISFQKAANAIKKGRLWVCDEINKTGKDIYIESNNRYFSSGKDSSYSKRWERLCAVSYE